MDAIDYRILAILQRDCDLTNQQIAERVGVSPSSALRRIDRLERMKIIRRRVALLDAKALDIRVTAFVHVQLKGHSNRVYTDAFIAELCQHKSVAGLHTVAGEIDLIAQIKCRTVEELKALTDQLFGQNGCVLRYSTHISLHRHKESSELPLPEQMEEEAYPE